jgi:FtsP/CotA-like multicopper oxidase with cupredoxin domain
MGRPVRSKKMAGLGFADQTAATRHFIEKMVRIGPMARASFPPNRRELMAGLGAVAFSPALPSLVKAEPLPTLALHAKTDVRPLRPPDVDALLWSIRDSTTDDVGRIKRGDRLGFAFLNELSVPAELNWHGLEGHPESLFARPGLAAGEVQIFQIPFRQAGTFLCDLRLLGDGQARPSRALALVVEESEPVAVDRDQVFLIEDWRLRPDGTAIAPGIDPRDTAPVYTINGLSTQDIPVRTNERLRFRFISGCQRSVIAIKIAGHEVRVMAIDGQPAEPFPARNGAVVLAPGTRVDAFIDATAPPGSTSSILLHDGKEPHPIARLIASNAPPMRAAPLPLAPPLPSNGLPIHLDLKSALRFDVALGGPQTDWATPATFAVTALPSFRAKVGRTVVLALTNRAEIATVFHLHGHHFRLLDRLDDGWKPFWLDTLAVEPGQTQRIAFAAEHAGRWLIESMTTDWAAPRLVRWYSVE